MDTEAIFTIILPPLTALCGWFAGTRKRKNDALGYMQQTIDGLVQKNSEYVAEITNLRQQVAALASDNAKLQAGQREMQAKLDKISSENDALRKIIELRTVSAKTKKNGTAGQN